MELNADTVKEQVKAKKADLEKFAKEAQDELTSRNQNIQKQNTELQELVRKFQSEIDKRMGAIESLETLVATPKPKVVPKPKEKKG